MNDLVIIRDLVVEGIIGVYLHERQNPQTILINIRLHTDLSAPAASDDIADCIDYDRLARQIRAHAETAARFTVEALAEDLAQICLQESNAFQVSVRVEKPNAISFTSSVGVEITRQR